MCAVSMITDHYKQKWPIPNLDLWPTTDFKPVWDKDIKITLEQWNEYQELKKAMEKYDADTNQPDCAKPDVVIWESIIQQIVKEQNNG